MSTQRTALVITTISSSEHPILRDYAEGCKKRNIEFIIAGDKKTPADFHLEHAQYLDIDQQKLLPFQLAKLLPQNTYARKNLAYLSAIRNGCKVIIETDDDNKAMDSFWEQRSEMVTGELLSGKGWLNAYSYFTDADIWPRGFSLQHLDKKCNLTSSTGTVKSPIHQGLANDNPDVDAIIRLNGDLPLSFNTREPLLLAPGLVCPFNSQNTTWFPAAFLLMYIPATCSFRMCDIWRSFVALRIMRENNWSLVVHEATVVQDRNEHDLFDDLRLELDGYVYNHHIIEKLDALKLQSGEQHIAANMILCYDCLLSNDWVDAAELPMLRAWLKDVAESL